VSVAVSLFGKLSATAVPLKRYDARDTPVSRSYRLFGLRIAVILGVERKAHLIMVRIKMVTARVVGGLALVAGTIVVAPEASADGCPPGHLNNEFTGQCYVQGSAPTINGIPCVASKTGLCSSFYQNQQPPRRPTSG
jgi:hypothetical protein